MVPAAVPSLATAARARLAAGCDRSFEEAPAGLRFRGANLWVTVRRVIVEPVFERAPDPFYAGIVFLLVPCRFKLFCCYRRSSIEVRLAFPVVNSSQMSCALLINSLNCSFRASSGHG